MIDALWPRARQVSRAPLGGRQVAAVAVAIAVLSFATHLAFRVGDEQFHVQLALFPQYAILFALGCAAGRRGWLETLTPRLLAPGPRQPHSPALEAQPASP